MTPSIRLHLVTTATRMLLPTSLLLSLTLYSPLPQLSPLFLCTLYAGDTGRYATCSQKAAAYLSKQINIFIQIHEFCLVSGLAGL